MQKNKKQVCIYIDTHDYNAVKMFALTHQVTISKFFEDAATHLMEDDKDDVSDFYYRLGGF